LQKITVVVTGVRSRGGAVMVETGQHRWSASMVIIAILAVVQGLLGLLRTAHWIEIGSDLSARGAVLLPIFGMMVIGRGILVALIAVLYGVFAWGLLARRGWARGVGLGVAVVHLILAGLALAGDFIAQDLLWVVVPVIVVVYLLSPGRPALAGAPS
jgi:hypothetical protein